MFSSRLPPNLTVNAMAAAVAALRARGDALIDLTESNPTRVGLEYPEALLAPLGDVRGLTYAPDSLGLWPARVAIARDAARRRADVDPHDVALTASTSEAYAWLFKLLCDPGDCVLVPRPSYPLFEHLTRLDSVESVAYDVDYHGRWSIDFTSIADAPARTRAVLVVSPNNPTGSFISSPDLERLSAICVARGWALIADEVFVDYPLSAGPHVRDLAVRATASSGPGPSAPLTFTLGGASKSLGLPQVKLGWIVVGGAADVRHAALERLELIADTYLSVSTPVQLAAGSLLDAGAVVRTAIQARLEENLRAAHRLAADVPSCELLPVDGGWSAVLRVPAVRSEEQMVLDLLQRERVLVHPGYFFDFRREAYLVVSLLVPPAAFADGLGRVLRLAGGDEIGPARFNPANS